MITAPDRLLHRLEWRVVRRLDGRLQGGYRTPRRGSGLDFAGLRPYVDGDDARHIDWNVTARLDELQVREFTEDRELTAWLVLDRSASMRVGGRAGGSRTCWPSSRWSWPGCSAGAATGSAPSSTTPARPASSRPAPDATRPCGSVGSSSARPTPGRRRPPTSPRCWTRSRRWPGAAWSSSISDFIGTGDWERPLIRLAHRNEVVALRVVDAADDALPEVGLIVVEDAETGEQLLVDSTDPRFRARFADGVDEREAGLRAGMRRAGVPLHRVDTGSDLVEVLLAIIAETRRRRAMSSVLLAACCSSLGLLVAGRRG